MMEPHFLFATPVVTFDNLNYQKEDHDYLLNITYENVPSEYHTVSIGDKVLDGVPNLKNWILKNLQEYSVNTLSTNQPLKITQSWCIKHNPGSYQKLHKHMHYNSIISGAYYVEALPDTQPIRFHRAPHSFSAPTIFWPKDQELEKTQPWNWEWHEISVKTGRLVLFPSYLHHSVESTALSKNLRCVLSFNSWFEGPIGSKAYKLGEVSD